MIGRVCGGMQKAHEAGGWPNGGRANQMWASGGCREVLLWPALCVAAVAGWRHTEPGLEAEAEQRRSRGGVG